MSSSPIQTLSMRGVALTHARLAELVKLADAARPFYDWVEAQARDLTGNAKSLSEQLLTMPEDEIAKLVLRCHRPPPSSVVPLLFDGIGRPYAHPKAVYYFFAWLVRDSAQQRLQPILSRVQRATPGSEPMQIQVDALAKLIVTYRAELGTFEWIAIREIIIERLEGSRRSIKGRESEVVVRTALSSALQSAYDTLGGYGRFVSITVSQKEVKVLGETFDVSVVFNAPQGECTEHLLIPVKTRETEGGGHAHLFTRDIEGAMTAVRGAMANREATDTIYWLAAFIIAESWAPSQAEQVDEVCDFAVALKLNPTEFKTLGDAEQRRFDAFIAALLSGTITPKALQS